MRPNPDVLLAGANPDMAAIATFPQKN